MDDLLAKGHFETLTDTLINDRQPAPAPTADTKDATEAERRFRERVYAEVSVTALLCR